MPPNNHATGRYRQKQTPARINGVVLFPMVQLQSAVQHLSSAAGAFLSARMLHEGPGGRLEGVPRIALVSMALTSALPLLLFLVEGRVQRRPREPTGPAPLLVS